MLGRLILLVGGIVGMGLMIAAGKDMNDIESVAGNTVAEAYYQTMGDGLIALGIMLGLIAVGLALKDFPWDKFDFR